MTHFGDITKIHGADVPPVDAVIGGSPCQGLSIAIPPWTYVLRRLSLFTGSTHPTMASLFDGIGGFPLIWQRLNGEGTCIWASEIEEFPIAVTKYHFSRKGE